MSARVWVRIGTSWRMGTRLEDVAGTSLVRVKVDGLAPSQLVHPIDIRDDDPNYVAEEADRG